MARPLPQIAMPAPEFAGISANARFRTGIRKTGAQEWRARQSTAVIIGMTPAGKPGQCFT
jgi:hypothetical protein